MVSYVALLRGINVGGRNKVRMEDLQRLVRAAGHTDVSTYIQSGNVVFTGARRATSAVEADLEGRLEKLAGCAVSVMVRTGREMASVLDANPFAGDDVDPTKVHVLFLKEPPSAQAPALDARAFEPERCAVRGREVFLYYPNGLGRATLTTALLERRLGTAGTARNWNTVTTLAAMAAR